MINSIGRLNSVPINREALSSYYSYACFDSRPFILAILAANSSATIPNQHRTATASTNFPFPTRFLLILQNKVTYVHTNITQ